MRTRGRWTQRFLGAFFALIFARGFAVALVESNVPVLQMAADENPWIRLGLHVLAAAGLAVVTNVACIAVRVPIDEYERYLYQIPKDRPVVAYCT